MTGFTSLHRLLIAALIIVATASPTLAVVYPRTDFSTTRGLYEGMYFAIRDVSDAPLGAERRAQIEASSLLSRQFFAANSGGQYDLRYTQVLDVPLTLNADRTRNGDWIADAENYVRSHYGLEPEDFHANIFDVSATAPDPGQGWSGLAWIPSNNYAIQADINSGWGQLVVDHEHGHRIGAPHSGAWRVINDSNYTPYVYDFDAGQYVEYSASTHGSQVAPFGVHNDEYGNPFDVMGNISNGHFTVHEKLTDLEWLTSTQVPDLNRMQEGTYRIYAHDELTPFYVSRFDIHGVEETYSSDSLYGLRYSRPVKRFDASSGQWVNDTQEVTLEYRSGRDGLQFHLGDSILDVDLEGGSDRNNLERELEVGKSIREIDFGVNFYASSGDGDDFLSHNPPAPSLPWEVRPTWFEFKVLGLGSDSIGSYVDLVVAKESYALETGVSGDLNFDGILDRDDWLIFAANTHTDLTAYTKTGLYLHGDFNSDGRNNHDDFLIFREWFIDANGANAFALMLRVPEPTSLALVGFATIATVFRRRTSASSIR
ncbi:PEP-CTERM sorting domain-containing protein [Botrimarina mediterranea]|uniref:PEP-CTERM sorting domain-containing protein n=1 Tax=Botrimarina mediterranea TaxID=2528022 RepID=UPI001187C5CF|nr:hypothetical protein K2D_23240 [Planctomycetes bacterium K2D]